MGHKSRVSPTEAHARDRAVRAAIGRMLCAQYELAEPLPERLRELLKQLEDADERAAVATSAHYRPRAAKRIGSIPSRNWHPNEAL